MARGVDALQGVDPWGRLVLHRALANCLALHLFVFLRLPGAVGPAKYGALKLRLDLVRWAHLARLFV